MAKKILEQMIDNRNKYKQIYNNNKHKNNNKDKLKKNIKNIKNKLNKY